MQYKGKLEGFPVEVVELMLQRQEEQGNPRNIEIFENKVYAPWVTGGFNWGITPEKWYFWGSVINDKNFDVFFEKYPKDKEENNMQYKGKLEGFPVEVVELMLQRQEEQGNPRNIEIFEENSDAWIDDGGFTWGTTPEKLDFWGSVIEHKNFDVFFEKYPKTVSELPKVMLVSDNGEDWYERVVFAFKKGCYVAWRNATTLKAAEHTLETIPWRLAKELPKAKIKLTKKNLLKVFPDLDIEDFEEV